MSSARAKSGSARYTAPSKPPQPNTWLNRWCVDCRFDRRHRDSFPSGVRPAGGRAGPLLGDVGLGEELAQEALVDAIEQWPVEGTPRNPGAWLMTVGKRKAIDLFRRNEVLARKYAELSLGADRPDLGDASGDEIPDDRLRLIFVACHPLLPVQARAALTLRLLGA